MCESTVRKRGEARRGAARLGDGKKALLLISGHILALFFLNDATTELLAKCDCNNNKCDRDSGCDLEPRRPRSGLCELGPTGLFF